MADVYIRFGVIYVTRIDLIKKKRKGEMENDGGETDRNLTDL
jgi:hypothetical protein